MTPVLTTGEVAATLTLIACIYALIFGFGALYILRLLRAGPIPKAEISLYGTNPKRPLSLPGASPGVTGAAGIGD